MPAQPIGVWGIDLGQCGLKAIRLQEIDGQIVATAFDYVEHPKILSQPDADPDQLTREALDKFLSRNNLRGDIVAISVPGQSGLARFVKLPPVEEKKIADIVRFEAKQQIPFNLDEVVWDYQKIGSGVVTDGFAMETEIGLFAMKRDMVGRYLQHFKDVNVDVHVVQMAPLALCNYVSFDLLGKDVQAQGGEGGGGGGDKKCVVALDIGADSSNLVITDGERIIWQRPIPLGGNHFTRALTKDLKLTFAKAEHLKRNATKSPDLKKILAALRPVLNDFVGEVQRSLGYFTNTHRDASIEYLIGLGNAFRLPGLQKFLSEKLQLEVKKLGKMERINGDQVVAQQVFTENILTFGVAYGLALQGLKRARLLTNLLPQEIRVERLIKAKKPFAVAAAAALLFAAGGLALSYALEKRTYGSPRVIKAVEAANAAKKKADSNATAFKAAKDKVEDEKKATKTIVAGQFERDNWPELYKFISAAIPQADGQKHTFTVLADDGSVAETIVLDNIPKEFEPRYVNSKAARDAYNEFRSQRLKAEAGGNGSDDPSPGAEHLIQFNIESVQAFFSDNLSTYWDQVKASDRVKHNRDDLVRPKEQYKKNPEGKGWIIEIQGWTYHQDKESFIKNTLLENLARLGIRDKKADAAPSGAPTPPGTAPAPTPPGSAPAPPPLGGAQGTPGQPGAAEAAQEPLGPVLNHISHIVLYKYTESSAHAPFELLGESTHEEVKSLALGQPPGGKKMDMMMPSMAQAGSTTPSGTPSGGSPTMPSAPGGAPGSGQGGSADTRSRANWTPLGEETDARSRSMGMLGGTMLGRTSGPDANAASSKKQMEEMKKMGMRQPGRGPVMSPNAPGQTASPPPEEEKGPKRTEFVILFIWKEPTPSDALRGLPAEGGGAGGTASAAASTPEQVRPKPKPKADSKAEPKADSKAEPNPKKDENNKPKPAAPATGQPTTPGAPATDKKPTAGAPGK